LAQHGEFLSQNADLGVFGAVASTTQHKKIQHDAHKTIEEDGSRDDVGDPGQTPSDRIIGVSVGDGRVTGTHTSIRAFLSSIAS
jgi:hypothetical protein